MQNRNFIFMEFTEFYFIFIFLMNKTYLMVLARNRKQNEHKLF